MLLSVEHALEAKFIISTRCVGIGSRTSAGIRKWIHCHILKRPIFALGGKPPTVAYWQRIEQHQPFQQA